MPIDARPRRSQLAGATTTRRGRRPRRGSDRARSDGAHRHRSEPDREAAARVVVGTEPGRHAGVARRRRRLERVLPSGRRSRADAVLDRQPADHRSAEPAVLEPDLAGRRAVDGGHHRRGAGGVRRQEQPRRAHRHQVRARSAEADRQRVVRLRLVQEPDRRSQHRRAARTRSATSCRSAACGPIGSSIRPSSRRCTTTGNSVSFFDRLDFHPSDTDTFHLNLQAARSAFDVPNTYDQMRGQAQHQDINTVQRRARLLARHRLEDAVHGERVRAPGPPDLPAERRSVRRHAGHVSARIAR